MILIDGSEGEGGGQVLRNACAMSLITGEPFRITKIRGGREKPGLMRQHVTAIEAACAIGSAVCDGLAIGSAEITFQPGRVVPGDYRFAVGTAGSSGLVLQTILPPLMLADGPSRLVLEGGTHNMAAPPFDFIAKTFLPIIDRMGPRIAARLLRHGFYPRGGGRMEVDIAPAKLTPIACLDRGALLQPVGYGGVCRIARSTSPIGEIRVARAALRLARRDACAVRQLPEDQGPGNHPAARGRFRAGDRNRQRLRQARRLCRVGREECGVPHGRLSGFAGVRGALSGRPAAAAFSPWPAAARSPP